MNKRSVKRSPAKAGANVVRKAVSRQVSVKPRQVSVKPPQVSVKPGQVPVKPEQAAGLRIATATVPHTVTVRSAILRSHKFRVGQTVLFTSSPITRPGASGTYKVVKLLPSDGDDYQYRIKNPGEAFERVAKESQLELEH